MKTNVQFAEVEVGLSAALLVIFIAVSLRLHSWSVFLSTFYERNVYLWSFGRCEFLNLSLCFFGSVELLFS